MENKFKNEMLIEVGGEKILLRPTFENLAAMESKMGGLAYLAFKYGKGIDIGSGKIDPLDAAKSLPPLTDAVQIIYFNQHVEEGEKRKGLEEIHQLCMTDGIKICTQIVIFLARCTAGNKFAAQPTKSQKKS